GELLVSEDDRQRAIALCRQADRLAALEAMQAFGIADFRDDLAKVTVPTLVLHGDADGVVPLEGSGARTHAAIPHSDLVAIEGAPHGCNLTHAGAFNAALLRFLKACRLSRRATAARPAARARGCSTRRAPRASRR